MIPLLIGLAGFIGYTYAGYLIVLWLWARHRRGRIAVDTLATPTVTVVIAAYNEEACIAETLDSILAADYPADALEVIVVSDQSTDRTDAIVSGYPADRVRLDRPDNRSGQTFCQLQGAALAKGEIVLFADASGQFFPDTLRGLIGPFSEPDIGAVSGHKVIAPTGGTVAKGDSFHFRYDATLRYLESLTGSSWVGCQGGLYAIRKALVVADFPLDIAADNAMCYALYERGYRHVLNPAARVLEKPSKDLATEFRRKVRIVALQLRGVWHFRRLFVPWKHPAFFFQNLSHKIFRWGVPFALLIFWVATGFSRGLIIQGLFYLQTFFYALALAGLFYGRRHKISKLLSIPAYFTAVNAAGIAAWRALFRSHIVWTPPARETLSARLP